jgi:hypothetical protein
VQIKSVGENTPWFKKFGTIPFEYVRVNRTSLTITLTIGKLMEKSCYDEIIEEVSKKLAGKVMGTEKELIKRAVMIDGDIRDIVQEIGRQTYKRVLEETRDQIAEKKSEKD